VCELLAALDKTGIADNTLIMFTCDNGSSAAGILRQPDSPQNSCLRESTITIPVS
jgi:arylsulfatase A-like enzyme